MATAAGTRSRSQLANDAWEAAMTAHAVLMRRFAQDEVWQLASMREYDVLYTLAKARGPLRLGALGERVLLSQPALSRLVDRLEERGLVSRCADPSDARAAHISLTETGHDLQRRIGRVHGGAVAASMTAALTDEQLALLEDLSTILAQENS